VNIEMNLNFFPASRTSLPLTLTVVNLSLATNEVYKDKASGKRKTVTEWHRLVFLGKVRRSSMSFDSGRAPASAQSTATASDVNVKADVYVEVRF
jgi:hypothetical protein